MLYGMYLSAAGALVEEARQGVIANNIANASTGGFKADTAVFRKRLTEAREGTAPPGRPDRVLEGLTGGVFLDAVEFSSAPGSLSPTQNSLDLALRGDGYFAVTDGARTLYTRAGNFARNAAGDLVTADGAYRVLGTKGKPIHLGPGEVKVNRSGEVTVDEKPSGQLLVLGSLDPARFEKVGANVYRCLGNGLPPASKAEVLQGVLEGSNVSPVGEMVKLIQSHRAYEANLQMARIQDSSLARAVNELGRTA